MELFKPEDSRNFTEAVERACEERSLQEAIAYICIWEADNLVQRIRTNSAGDGKWESCFTICVKTVMDKFNSRPAVRLEDICPGVTLKLDFGVGSNDNEFLYIRAIVDDEQIVLRSTPGNNLFTSNYRIEHVSWFDKHLTHLSIVDDEEEQELYKC